MAKRKRNNIYIEFYFIIITLIIEIEEYDSEEEETNISDDPNNNKNQQSKVDPNNMATNTNNSVSYFSRSRLNNTKSCYQLQDMSLHNPSRTQNSFSNPQHVPKV